MLDGGELKYRKIIRIAKENIKAFLAANPDRDMKMVSRYILDNLSYSLDEGLSKIDIQDDRELLKYLLGIVGDGLASQEEKLGSVSEMGNFMRIATLQAIDDAWVEQVDYLQQLQSAVMGRASAQRNPVHEYQRDGLESFQEMEKTVQKNVIRNILLSNVYLDKEQKLRILLP